jgi:hypothetical protein
MANAIPVMSGKEEPQPKVNKPTQNVPENEHEKFIGKDHPDFGRWDPAYKCWRLDN